MIKDGKAYADDTEQLQVHIVMGILHSSFLSLCLVDEGRALQRSCVKAQGRQR